VLDLDRFRAAIHEISHVANEAGLSEEDTQHLHITLGMLSELLNDED